MTLAQPELETADDIALADSNAAFLKQAAGDRATTHQIATESVSHQA